MLWIGICFWLLGDATLWEHKLTCFEEVAQHGKIGDVEILIEWWANQLLGVEAKQMLNAGLF